MLSSLMWGRLNIYAVFGDYHTEINEVDIIVNMKHSIVSGSYEVLHDDGLTYSAGVRFRNVYDLVLTDSELTFFGKYELDRNTSFSKEIEVRVVCDNPYLLFHNFS